MHVVLDVVSKLLERKLISIFKGTILWCIFLDRVISQVDIIII